MVFNTSIPSDLAKLTLIADDQSYLDADNGTRVQIGDPLAPLNDTPQYGDPPPPYPYEGSGFFVREIVDDKDTAKTGFKAIIYQNSTTKEIIVAFAGTDGPNPVDWWSNASHLGWNQWDNNRNEVFQKLRTVVGVDFGQYAGKIHFTGQSLGGALAQYAAYDFLQTNPFVKQKGSETNSFLTAKPML